MTDLEKSAVRLGADDFGDLEGNRPVQCQDYNTELQPPTRNAILFIGRLGLPAGSALVFSPCASAFKSRSSQLTASPTEVPQGLMLSNLTSDVVVCEFKGYAARSNSGMCNGTTWSQGSVNAQSCIQAPNNLVIRGFDAIGNGQSHICLYTDPSCTAPADGGTIDGKVTCGDTAGAITLKVVVAGTGC